MKLLRKIAPLAIAGLFIGASMGWAMAADLGSWKANFPGADTAVVLGSSAAAEDTVGAIDIAAALGTSTGGEVPVEGAKLIKAPGNDLNLFRWFQDVKDTLSDDDLPTILAEGTYRESRGENENDLTFTQKFFFDNSGQTNMMVFDAKEEGNKAAGYYLYLDDGAGINASTYQLAFDNPVKYDGASNTKIKEDFQLSKIKILGREYTFVDGKDNGGVAGAVDELTLMAGALKASQWEYSKASYTLGNKTYEVEAKIISDTDSTAILVINGEETDEMAEGDTYTLEDGTRVGVVDVIPNEGAEKSTGTSEGNDLVTFYLGAEKIKFIHGQEVELNGQPVDGSDVVLSSEVGAGTPGELDKITLAFVPDDKIYVGKGESWTDPILGRFKYTYQGIDPAINYENISMTSSGSDGELNFLNNAKKELPIPVSFDDGTTGTEGAYPGDDIDETAAVYALTVGGVGSEGNLALGNGDICTGTANVEGCKHIMFIAVSTGGEAHLMEIQNIDTTDSEITFKDLTKVKTYDAMPYTGGADTFDLFTPVTLTVNVGAHTVTFNTIDNYKGLGGGAVLMQTSLAGDAMLTYGLVGGKPATGFLLWRNDGWGGPPLFAGVDFESDNAVTNPEMHVDVLTGGLVCDNWNMARASCESEKNSDWRESVDDGTSPTNGFSWGMHIKWNDQDDNNVEIDYPENQVAANVYVSEVLTTIPELGMGGAAGAVTPVLDSDIDNVKTMNLIVVGGTAINKAANTMLGTTFPTYGTDSAWQNATGVDAAGKAVVKLMDSPYTTGKFAMLVAGWEGVDTARAAKALREGTPALTGQKVLLNTATSTVTVITA